MILCQSQLSSRIHTQIVVAFKKKSQTRAGELWYRVPVQGTFRSRRQNRVSRDATER